MVGGGLEDSEAFDVIPIFAPFSHEKLATQAKLLWTRACDKIRENHEDKVGSRAATSVFGQSETSYSVPLHITSHSIVR